MDVVAKTMTRVAQEILLKQNTISANVIMRALASAAGSNSLQLEESTAIKRFVLADLNRMLTRAKRVNTSFVGGTPDARQGKGITDIIVSPELVEELRAIAYNPINTKGTPMDADGGTESVVRTADFIAQEAYSAAGAPQLLWYQYHRVK